MVYIEGRPRANPTSWRVGWNHRYTKARCRITFPTDDTAKLAAGRVDRVDHDITEEELLEYLSPGRSRAAETHALAPKAPTFKEWAEEWINGKLDIGERTRKEYRIALLGRPARMFGSVQLPDIDQKMIARLVAKANAEVRPPTVHYMHAVLRECLNHSIPRWRSDNPCDPPSGQKRNLPKVKHHDSCFLTLEEERLIIECSPPGVADLIDTLCNTGMRLGEALGLQCGRVLLPSVAIGALPRDETEAAIYVVDAKTDAGYRVVDITRRLAEQLRPRIEGRRPTDLVFTSPRGGKWDPHNLRDRYWHRTLAAASRCDKHPPPLKIYKRGPERPDPMAVSTCLCPGVLRKWPQFKDLRHSHVDHLLKAGWDLDVIRQRIGHEKVSTTITMYSDRQRRGHSGTLVAIDPMA